MVKCFDDYISSLEAKHFEEKGENDFVKSKTEILIKEYLH